MYAVIACFNDGRIHLIGFANNEEEINAMIETVIAKYGAERLERMGVHFNVELAA